MLAPWHLLCEEVSAGAYAFVGADHTNGNADVYNAYAFGGADHTNCNADIYNAYAFGGADRTNGNADIYNATQGQATGCYVDQNKITYGEDVSVTIQFSLCPNDWMVCSDKIACPLKEEENFCGKSAKWLKREWDELRLSLTEFEI